MMTYRKGEYVFVAETIDNVVIDHADGLHQGVADGGSDEFESPPAHILAHGEGFRAGGRDLVQSLPVVLNGTVIHELPDIVVETAKFRLGLQETICIGDKGPDLEIVADNSRVLQQCLDLGFIVAGHPVWIESVKCRTIGFPFIQNG